MAAVSLWGADPTYRGLADTVLGQPIPICKHGGGGLILPLFGDSEHDWPNGLRVVLYLVGLLWCFVGVAIISDVFMGAIEKITSKKNRVRIMVHGEAKLVTVRVWNDTVANLTLMALGSSAPEILLSVIELFSQNMFSGHLGPSTIVGSAAFNLLVISAVCIMAVPDGQVRAINDVGVFVVTASCSIFAYVWLLLVLQVSTPDVVDIWEAVITLALFPALVAIAYAADRGKCWPSVFSGKSVSGGSSAHRDHVLGLEELSAEEITELMDETRQRHGAELTDDAVMRIIQAERPPRTTRAQHRIHATRVLTGRAKSFQRSSVAGSSAGGGFMSAILGPSSSPVMPFEGKSGKTVSDEARHEESAAHQPSINFSCPRFAIMEGAGKVVLPLVLSSPVDQEITIHYETVQGTATAGDDYVPVVDGQVTIKAGELASRDIAIEVLDDDEVEDDENFWVRLTKVTKGAVLGKLSVAEVTIIDDDEAGELVLEKEELRVMGDEAEVVVLRANGCSGRVTVQYVTEADNAVAPNDYTHTEGELVMENNRAAGVIKIPICSKSRSSPHFRLILSDPTGGAKFCSKTDGGEDALICTIWIEPRPDLGKARTTVPALLNLHWGKVSLGASNWQEQFSEAIWVNGSKEEQAEASVSEWMMHIITVPWKVVFALCPPLEYMDGWLTFWVSLIMIGGVTAIIGDVAALLGCTMEIPDSVTAITLVALGTSLPDTFASRLAAIQDPYADASVGNVTGSNSVNVFLGLGLPWVIGSIYWKMQGATQEWIGRVGLNIYAEYPDGGLVVEAGDLTFSVLVFTICAFFCLAMLVVRRAKYGGELGGPKQGKRISAAILVALWVVYISVSSAKSLASKND
ncbi:Sodium/calcium exchanger 2 [Perkinsus chesapeaki]|uniref:Sodium/calcium exchanger 2 n=1 Tax=Perkinsus chesapeaki TaxID=330153 RepID=A0A7J6MCY4_PERCH|nr:Sodium/calcium exchanger 2 [Perkinsus chesapeaki]